MEDLTKIIIEAQNDPNKLNALIENFLPFIKRCVALSKNTKQSRDDALTLAMLTFADCAIAYDPEKGAFLPFVQTVIRNRLVDEFRHESKNTVMPLSEDGAVKWEMRISIEEYQRQVERVTLRLEIDEVSETLSSWGISFAELVKVCPKQKRTRAQCQYISTLILKNEVWRSQFIEKHRLPNKEMCDVYGVSKKILEKYRKYIAAICVIQSGDYPMLKAFLPVNRGRGEEDE